VDSFDLQQSLKDIQKRYHGFQGTEEEIASLFTYFDCTDYTDQIIKPNSTLQRVLSLKRGRWEPGLIYYIRLTLASALRKINTHGGYFDGQFTQQVMYRLAFLGFGGFLDSLSQNNRQSALDYLSEECDRRKIQVLLSSARYEIDILDGQFTQQVMYRLAFLGFGGFLDSLSQNNRQSALDYLSEECDHRKIQVLLSSARYEVDILGCDRQQIRREMLKS